MNQDEDEAIASIKFFNNNDFRSQVILSWHPKATLSYEIKFMAFPETLIDKYDFIKNSLWQNVTMEELSEKINIGLKTWKTNETIIKCMKFIFSKSSLESSNLLDCNYWSKNLETWKNFIQALDDTIKKINESSKKKGVLYFRSYIPQKEMQEIQTKQEMLQKIFNLAKKNNVPCFPIHSIPDCADNDFYELVNLTSNDKVSRFFLNGGRVSILG